MSATGRRGVANAVQGYLKGVLQLARPLPLLTWSATSVALGWANAPGYRSGWPGALIMVLAGGILLQGYITHGLNDLYDWHSGTDQTTPGVISGGSHVLRAGLLTTGQMWRVVLAATFASVILLIWLASWRGSVLAALGGIALITAAAYSVPPLRLCYRPLIGEWLGIFPALVCGTLAAGFAVSERWSLQLLAVAVIQGVVCVASVMEHHLVDIDSDWAAHPRKQTSPAFWQRQVGRPGREVALGYQVVGLALSVGAAWLIASRIWWSVLVVAVGVVIIHRTRTGDHGDELRRDILLKSLAIIHALGYVAMAVIGLP